MGRVLRAVWTVGALGVAACGAGPDRASTDAAVAATPSALAGFRDPNECAGCHPIHAAEWKISPHAYALRDPVFAAMVKLGQRETKGRIGQFCVRCHSPIAVETDQTPVTRSATGEHRQDLEAVDATARQGVSCDSCHTVSNVRQTGNAGLDFDPTGPRRAPIADPVRNVAHKSMGSSLHTDSRLCGACHQVVSEFFNEHIALETTFAEWVRSSFNGRKSCQDCHMPTYVGQAAPGAPERTLHRHFFESVDVSLLDPKEFPGYDELRQRSEAFLRTAVELGVRADVGARALTVSLKNLAGHALPSGATADRELWLEVIVRDARGSVVLESGTLDALGDLRDGTSGQGKADPQLAVFRQQMSFDPKREDEHSVEPVRAAHFLWEANAESSQLLRSEQTVQPAYDLAKLHAGKHSAHVRVLLRAFPAHLLRDLEQRAGLSAEVRQRMPLFELASADLSFDLP